MIFVEVINNNVEAALLKLKRKIKKSGILTELFDRKGFIKPSDRKRRDKQRAIARERYKNKGDK